MIEQVVILMLAAIAAVLIGLPHYCMRQWVYWGFEEQRLRREMLEQRVAAIEAQLEATDVDDGEEE